MGRQDLRRLREHRSFFFFNMLLDMVLQRVESGLKRWIIVDCL
jgi:hypothetical protein